MSGFAPGDEVVCVDAGIHREWPANWGVDPGHLHAIPNLLTVGAHYIVNWCGEFATVPCVRLVGIKRLFDVPFAASRFRPARRESIEVFRQMCDSNKPLVEVRAMSAAEMVPPAATMQGHLADLRVRPFIQSGVIHSLGHGSDDENNPLASVAPDSFGTQHSQVAVGPRTPCGPGVAQTAGGDRPFIRGAS